MALLQSLCKRLEIRGSARCQCRRGTRPLLSSLPLPSLEVVQQRRAVCSSTTSSSTRLPSWSRFVSQREETEAHAHPDIERESSRSKSSKGNRESSSRSRFSVEFHSVGVFRSCFACRNGCPRQGALVPTSFGRVQLNDESFDGPAGQALKGLENFSHVWLVWSFHKHRSVSSSPRVKPPRLGGDSIGVFSCRSPKRPNPIGMTACKIESIDVGENEEGASLLVSGIDLLDGTPILDIKPYIPKYDSFEDSRVPDWLLFEGNAKGEGEAMQVADSDEQQEPQQAPRQWQQKRKSSRSIQTASAVSVSVEFESHVLEKMQSLSKTSLLFQGNSDAMKKAIQDVLTADPRSRISKKHEEQIYSFTLDNIYVTCSFRQQSKTEEEESSSELKALVTRLRERLSLSEDALLTCIRDWNLNKLVPQEGESSSSNSSNSVSPLGNRITLQSLTRMFYADPHEVEDLVKACIGKGLIRKDGETILPA